MVNNENIIGYNYFPNYLKKKNYQLSYWIVGSQASHSLVVNLNNLVGKLMKHKTRKKKLERMLNSEKMVYF